MAVYLVTYDLNTPGQNYTALIKAIESYTHCKALKSAYFVDSYDSAAAIRDNLMTHIDSNDMLFVLDQRQHWAANRKSSATEWLQDASRTWNK